MRRLRTLLLVICVCVSAVPLHAQTTDAGAEANSNSVTEAQPSEASIDRQAEQAVDELTEPLFTPFLERYVLDELKQLRQEMAAQKVELVQSIVDRDLSIGDRAMSYASNTVTYFFYLIAAVSSILVIVGWTSIRDIRDKVRAVADQEIQQLVSTYEKRLRAIEQQLTQKTQHIDANREEIEKTQEAHALWLRAAQEHAAASKIHIYDEILKLRPEDCEALTYKADAVLEMHEPHWAKALCYQALKIDSGYGHAHYQLACANVALGAMDEAMQSLEKAIKISDSFIDEAASDPALAVLCDFPEFKQKLAAKSGPINIVKN